MRDIFIKRKKKHQVAGSYTGSYTGYVGKKDYLFRQDSNVTKSAHVRKEKRDSALEG